MKQIARVLAILVCLFVVGGCASPRRISREEAYKEVIGDLALVGNFSVINYGGAEELAGGATYIFLICNNESGQIFVASHFFGYSSQYDNRRSSMLPIPLEKANCKDQNNKK